MRQRGDQTFTELLNRIRIGSQTENDIKTIQRRSITSTDDKYPADALLPYLGRKQTS